MGQLVLQTLANTLASGALLLVLALGFSLIHRTGRFFHLAHGSVFASAAFAGWGLHRGLGIGQWAAFPLAVVASVLVGLTTWSFCYRPIRLRQGGPLALLIGGLGADVVIRNALSLGFGDATRRIRSPFWESSVTVYGTHLSTAQVSMVCLAIVATASMAYTLGRTRFGNQILAVGDSPRLARSVGIDPDRVLLLSFLLSSVMAGLAGLLSALDTDLRPMMGTNSVLLAIAASVVAGSRGTVGLVLSVLLFSVVEQGGAWFVPIQWAQPAAMVVLILALCVRPHGVWTQTRRIE